MSRLFQDEPRDPIAQKAYDRLAEERSWEVIDMGRMGGSPRPIDLSDLDAMSDAEIVNHYMDREALRKAYENERR